MTSGQPTSTAATAAINSFTANELEFLERLNGAGEIVPALRTDDPALRAVIQQHPGLLSKAQNVKKHVAGAAKPAP